MRYAQIEKDTLAIVHSCKKFHYYIFGRPVDVESDHKPLQSIFSKPLQSAPMRLQSMMLRLQPYDLHVSCKPGKEIPIGDALNRANLPDIEPDIKLVLVNMIDFISITPRRYSQFQQCTANELNELHSTILKGWADTEQETPHCIREYWNVRGELSVLDGVIYKGMKIVVPQSLRTDMPRQIHSSHLGITKCKQRAREAIFWPGMNQQIEHLVNECSECNTYQNKQQKETLRPTKTPDFPWSEIATDLFQLERSHYLVTVDYFSKFIEVDQLLELNSMTTIQALKQQICRHGIPEILRSDNGPQFSSAEFQKFCTDFGIKHITSSPNHPQSNGEAERAVQTVKRLWSKNTDKELTLLDYRTTPLESCSLSPAQLCMSRRPRNKLPISRQLLMPANYDIKEVKRQLDEEKEKQRYYHDQKSSRDLPSLLPGDPVRMSPFPGSKQWLPATIVDHHDTPRSYIVQCNGQKYRRNRRHLHISTYTANSCKPSSLRDSSISFEPIVRPSLRLNDTVYSPDSSHPRSVPRTYIGEPRTNPSPCDSSQTTPKSTELKTRSGRVIKAPKRLDL